MASFPSWVPGTVVAYYEQLDKRECVDHLHDPETQTLESYYESERFQWGFSALRFAMESREMEKAWKAIDKRSDDTTAEIIARAILEIPFQLMVFDAVTDKSATTALSNLSDDLDKALARYRRTVGTDYSAKLSQESDWIRSVVENRDEVWDDMGAYVGQRYSQNAKRTYLIRLLAGMFEELFGSPLYDTVASFAGVILDEQPISPNHARKLVASPPQFREATRKQSDPEEYSS